jgi:transcription antitermination factor NusG
MVLEAMEKSGKQVNAVATTNAKMEATIAELTKQVAKLTNMNCNLVKALIAAGAKVADRNNAEKAKEKENASGNRSRKRGRSGQAKECQYCNKTHKNAGMYCLDRICNAYLRPDRWKGTEVDE